MDPWLFLFSCSVPLKQGESETNQAASWKIFTTSPLSRKLRLIRQKEPHLPIVSAFHDGIKRADLGFLFGVNALSQDRNTKK